MTRPIPCEVDLASIVVEVLVVVVVVVVVDVEVVVVGVVGNGTHTRWVVLSSSNPSSQTHEIVLFSVREHVECMPQPPLLIVQPLITTHEEPLRKVDW